MIKIKNFIFYILVFLCLSLTSGCQINQSDDLDYIYSLLDDVTLQETKNYFKLSDEAKFELVRKDDISENKYNKYVEKLAGLDFNNAIILVDKPNDFYLIVVYKPSVIDPNLLKLFLMTESRAVPIILNRNTYYIFPFSRIGRADEDYKATNEFELSYQDFYLLKIKSIENVELPGNVRNIFIGAGYKNNELVSLKCNSELDVIFDFAFYECSNLKSVILNENVEVYSNAFINCYNLEYVVVPRGAVISKNVFNYGNIFCEDERGSDNLSYGFATHEAIVYYSGEWEYNSEGIPTPR